MIYIIPLLFIGAYLYPYLPGHDLSWCAVKIATGGDCPGCGLVRSISALTHWNLSASLGFHPLGFVAAGWMAWLWIKAILHRPPIVGVGAANAFVLALFIIWIVRIAI
ncbi:MAG: hypothetical protein A3I09_01090 [Deltaproteobacteria bacterium RIFCSPLOWO2_02_FULL_47_10]|nr:MAG: hypothetical protein A3I09_01090 [Deltaproteobacteria bacterium RIFCSPLOWO2_02_FULL_47_10]